MNTGAFIHDLLDWIDNNLDSRLDIETVARRAGYSKWHLQRIFKEHTGYPLGEYIRAQKLQKSVERLAHSDEPVTPSSPSTAASSVSSARRPAHGDAASAARRRSDDAYEETGGWGCRMSIPALSRCGLQSEGLCVFT